jgi:hypothetical protein
MHSPRPFLALLAALSLGLLAGCGGDTSAANGLPTSNASFTILVSPSSASVIVGAKRQFNAQAHDANGNVVTGISFSWHSSDPAIAASVGGGVFKGVAPGAASITATALSSTNSGKNLTIVTSNVATLTVESAVAGTAAEGAAIQGGVVSLRDADGQIAAGSSDMAGRFHIPVAGLTAPYLLMVQDGEGRVLYGLALTAGNANIDPYTDLLVREWYALHGADPAAAFAQAAPLPALDGVRRLDRALTSLLRGALLDAGLDADHFSLLQSAFAADHQGFDRILDLSRVDAGSGHIEFTTGRGTVVTRLSLDTVQGVLQWTTTRTEGPGYRSRQQGTVRLNDPL